MRQAEVYRYSGRALLVVTGDAFNHSGVPHLAPILRQPPGPSPFVITLTEQDPLTGAVVLAPLRAAMVDLGRPVGMLTGPTWARVRRALALMFDL